MPARTVSAFVFAAVLAGFAGLAGANASTPQERAQTGTEVGPYSGLPLPRFVALKHDEANGRRRADANGAIDWIYQGRGLPLQVVGESGPWRRVRDPDGGEVWMHTTSLENRKTVYVVGGRRGETALRRHPRPDGRTVALLARGVVAEAQECQDGWVRVRLDDRWGWVRADALWGDTTCPS